VKAPAAAGWQHRHLLDVADLSEREVELVCSTAAEMAAVLGRGERRTTLGGRRVTVLMYEASTRTRVSFELAARGLSAEVVNIAAAGSSVVKGESLADTVRTIEALGSDLLVIRHARSGAADLAAGHFSGHVVNAGDGWHAHPSQALLDLYTLREALPGDGLRGRKVVILGDVLHSRVARSNVWTLTAAGVDLWLCGPATLLRGFEAWAAALPGERRLTVTTELDAALRDADAVICLRLQRERMASGLLPSLGEYSARYGLTAERLRACRPGAVVLHPGPINEGVEIAPDVAGGPASLVARQVTNGVAVRMAILELLAGARGAGGVAEAGIGAGPG
jgi:aspartate carbamoyltransferase catalytic subunit